MLGINARVEDLKKQLVDDINAAKMPACILDYLLSEILNDVRIQRASEVRKERKKYKEETASTPREVPVGEETEENKEVEEAKEGGGDGDNHTGS